ncbi:MAG: BTAD domain-containing putative transcriptional regulator [Chloroflexota bacterium]
MDFRILGRLEVLDEGGDIAPRRPKQRALLGLLLLYRNELIATDRLIEALWGDEPPNTASKALHGHVSALRKLLGPGRIRTEPGGYRLEVKPGELDLDRFEAALAAGRTMTDPRERAAHLAEALASWRGEPLADLRSERFAGPEHARLEALHLTAIEERVDTEMELGRHAELLPDLERFLGQNPLSERLRGQLMVALYRSGRQSEALRVYDLGRRLLAEEFGIDPGTPLQALEKRILLQDPALAAPPESESRGAPRQERRTVTVLVVEAAAARDTDPEDLEGSVGPRLAHARTVIEQLGGTAEPLFANALIGIFGAPRAHEDDPLRAVQAALELQQWAGGDGVSVRGGIDTGIALVTIEGSRVSVTGEVLGAAARFQLAAALGSVLVGEATHRLTEAMIEYRSIGPGTWSPTLRRRPPPSNGSDAPFVGRSAELALLERVAARALDERSVQLVTIVAEPGGGKSRLLQELRARLESSTSPPIWRQGGCLPYGEGVTYWALAEIVKAQARILESDDSQASAEKVSAAIRDLEPDDTRRTWLERSLRALVGLEQSPASGDREGAFAAWRQYLEATAGQAPLVVAFEDIHWADEAFLGFIDHVVSRASGVPLMVVCTARLGLLEAHPGWAGGKRNATTIALEPLNPSETKELLRTLLGRAPEPETIKRAGGNPLFAHELARVVDASPAREPIAVPESLQAVIAAHLDALPGELRAVASDAAVIGEVFWPGAIASMTAGDERDVESRLLRLVAHDITRRRRPSSVANQSEFAFLHVLVRDVAYWQLPRRDRIAKHRAVGEWIERLSGDRVIHHAELIAHHYVQALELARSLGDEDDAQEMLPRARTSLTLAGESARTVDLTQAESFYRRALELTGEDDPTHGRLLSRLSQIAELTGRLLEAEELCRQAIVELRAHADPLGAGEAMGTLTATMWRLGRPEAERRRVATGAVRTLEGLAPGPELVRAYSRMAAHELHAGRAGACGMWSRKALALADRLGMPGLKVQPLHHLGIARFETGDEAGIDDIREALRIGLEAGLSAETATAHTNLAAVVWVTEGPVPALALKDAAAAFASSRGLGSLERTIRAEALWQQFDGGAWDDALASADRLIAQASQGAPSRVTTMARTVKARILAERGRAPEASELEGEYLDRARELGDPQDLGPALAAGAALREARGDIDAAAALIAELERVTRGRDPSQRIHELPQAARICLASGSVSVAEALIRTRGAPTYTRARLCLASGRAIVAEAHGDLALAVDLHAAAADGWRAFGCPAEGAHALIGLGRCLIALGRAGEAAPSLRRARTIGRGLSAVAIVGESDRLLAANGRDARPPTPIPS